MQPLIFNLGPMELVIILVIVLLLFGGSRLAGLGKSTGRALKEFKEETKGLKGDADPDHLTTGSATQPSATQPSASQPSASQPAPQNPVQDPAADDVRRDG